MTRKERKISLQRPRGILWHILFLIFFGCGTVFQSQAQESTSRSDSVQFSLLTCSPGELIFELFGHTAIRYQNFTTGEDIVYNYGLFDFDSPNFIWRFMRGETDYELGAIPYYYFQQSYLTRGSDVFQQTIRLTPQEAFTLDSLLRDNLRPANKTYRYNYFYDNCTTRARDQIERALKHRIEYPQTDTLTTYRDWVQFCTKGHPWSSFAIDCCLGAEADRPLDLRQQLFLPQNLKKAFEDATVKDSVGNSQKLVNSALFIVPPQQEAEDKDNDNIFSPTIIMWTAWILILLSSWLEWKRHTLFWGLDLILCGIQGIIGLIITFLFFFSTHPTVGSNYLIILFNPLPLLYLPVMIYKVRKRQKDVYDLANATILTLFLTFLWAIPQKISLVIVPLALILLTRSVLHLANAYNKS